ncbi:OXYSTEROL-BINDING 4B-LIKE PROTEIN-RELATED [Salix viminalis]|uniref:OXYSTEROL-BINDING 4B-LIKE PROTEIN-RELATED n=1 Tax=Salix viminalis TaxID=40686 RepID=A0A9Q0V685_SALVM|nr:OXYSTEROL-BINDING 4B-LIKE PROTEIN-RELATED [Salix viminalis]
MDIVHGSTVTREKKTSLLQGDNFFFNRVISRNSSVGGSSRILYYRSAEGVPFTWEMQPGTPKDPPPKEEIIPPLSPPPALLGMGLPKPCFDIEEPKTSMRSRFRFWKNIKKNKRNEKPQQGSQGNNDIINATDESGKFEVFEFYSSDCDFIPSSPQNLSSSSSSSLSRTESACARYSMQEPHSCIPWNFTAVLSSVARRNY